MDYNILIGISGKLGTGKDSIAFILKRIDPTFQIRAYAYKLKQIVSLLTSCPMEQTMTQEGKNIYIEEFGLTIGQMQQQIGTNVMRTHFDEGVWIKALMMELKRNPGNYIVTDCRFKNEADAIKSAGGFVIRIERPDNPVARNSTRDLNHASETEMDTYERFDQVILNDCTLADLERKVRIAYNEIVTSHMITKSTEVTLEK